MNLYLYTVFAAVSLLASAAGAVCGIGGGVLIKPVLDAFGVLDVASISFLSGLTVLSMSAYSVAKARVGGSCLVEKKTGTFLALGAAIGGVWGKTMFQCLAGMAGDREQVGAVQALCLFFVTLGTFIYTLEKKRIKTHRVSGGFACLLIGLVLGVLSSFLGIGGGPINLVVLYFFFSMDTKAAAQNSLYIILFSQAASLLNSLATKTVPPCDLGLLAAMVACGILGGAAGRWMNRRMDGEMVNRLFKGLMLLIMAVCIYNTLRFAGLPL